MILPVLTLYLILLFAPAPALAVNPDEVLEDPVLEERARDLSAIIRCMKCQNQSIDDSNADLARDLRVLVRERLKAGDSDEEVLDYLVDRYGEFVLLRPSFSPGNLLLWLAAPLLLGVALILIAIRLRRGKSRGREAAAGLSRAEHERITKILDEGD